MKSSLVRKSHGIILATSTSMPDKSKVIQPNRDAASCWLSHGSRALDACFNHKNVQPLTQGCLFFCFSLSIPVLSPARMELSLLIVAHMVLCFALLGRTVLVTHRCLGCCCTTLTQPGQPTQSAQRDVPHQMMPC